MFLGKTPSIEAAVANGHVDGHDEVVKIPRFVGADFFHRGAHGVTSLYVACSLHRSKIMELLVPRPSKLKRSGGWL